jgi:hypothetical protein
MSYCVNCGVELADSEKRCPLCQTEVINPKAPWQEPSERPYSRHVDTIMKRIDRRYFATLAGLLLTIPCIITVLLDIISGGGLTWAAYVIGAVAVIYIMVLLPFFFKKYHAVIFLGADCAAVLLYLLFIETVNGGHWFLGLGLPMTVAASACLLVLALLFTKAQMSALVKSGAVMIATGLFLVCAEVIISIFVYGSIRFAWSLYALIPCAVVGVALLVLEHRQNLKERIRRRLFY